MDLMWSDPDPEPYDPHSGNPDWEHNTIRDAGCKWRLPLTKRFCERNGLKLIIRSHHPPHTGYEPDVFDAWLPHIVRWIEVQFSGTPMSEIFDSSDHNHSSTLYYSEFFDLVTNTLGTLLNKDVVFMLYNAFDPDETGYTQRGKWNDMFSRHKDAGYISDVQNWALGGWESDNKQQLMWDVWLIQRFRKFMRRLPPATAFKMLDQDKKG
eukprot:gene6176-9454_t